MAKIQITENCVVDRSDAMNWILLFKVKNTSNRSKHDYRWETVGYYATLQGALKKALFELPKLSLLSENDEITIKDFLRYIEEWGSEIVKAVSQISTERNTPDGTT